MTPERVAEALARSPDIAERIDTVIDWDFDKFEESIATADGLITWDLHTENLRARAPKLKWIHIIGAGIEHMPPLDWLLWRVPNLIARPHISSDDDVSYTPLTLDLFFDNARRVRAGKPPRNRVSPKLGY